MCYGSGLSVIISHWFDALLGEGEVLVPPPLLYVTLHLVCCVNEVTNCLSYNNTYILLIRYIVVYTNIYNSFTYILLMRFMVYGLHVCILIFWSIFCRQHGL